MKHKRQILNLEEEAKWADEQRAAPPSKNESKKVKKKANDTRRAIHEREFFHSGFDATTTTPHEPGEAVPLPGHRSGIEPRPRSGVPSTNMWRTAAGQRMRLGDMEEGHFLNSMRMIVRHLLAGRFPLVLRWQTARFSTYSEARAALDAAVAALPGYITAAETLIRLYPELCHEAVRRGLHWRNLVAAWTEVNSDGNVEAEVRRQTQPPQWAVEAESLGDNRDEGEMFGTDYDEVEAGVLVTSSDVAVLLNSFSRSSRISISVNYSGLRNLWLVDIVGPLGLQCYNAVVPDTIPHTCTQLSRTDGFTTRSYLVLPAVEPESEERPASRSPAPPVELIEAAFGLLGHMNFVLGPTDYSWWLRSRERNQLGISRAIGTISGGLDFERDGTPNHLDKRDGRRPLNLATRNSARAARLVREAAQARFPDGATYCWFDKRWYVAHLHQDTRQEFFYIVRDVVRCDNQPWFAFELITSAPPRLPG